MKAKRSNRNNRGGEYSAFQKGDKRNVREVIIIILLNWISSIISYRRIWNCEHQKAGSQSGDGNNYCNN